MKLYALIALSLISSTSAFAGQNFITSTLTYWVVSLGDNSKPRRCGEERQAYVKLNTQEKALGQCLLSFRDCALGTNQITFNGSLTEEMFQKYKIPRDGGVFLYYGCEGTSSIRGIQ